MNTACLTSACACFVVAVAGCGNEPRDTDTIGSTNPPPEAGSGPASPEATVTITSPRPGATVGPRFTATVDLARFVIEPRAIGGAPVAGRGHLHFQLDGGRFDVPRHAGPNGTAAEQLGVDGKYSPAVRPEITYRRIPPGRHRLVVFLANHDHTDTGVRAAVEFEVE